MSALSSTPAGSPPPAAAAALFERHEAGLRAYLSGLPGAEAARVDAVIQEIRGEVPAQLEFEDDPTVWMFAQGRRRVAAGGHRGDVLAADDGPASAEDETVAGEDAAVAVHQAFERLTKKQQEVVRLKFQFGFNLVELARITGVSFSGAAGLLHSAVERTCRAAGTALTLGEDRRVDVRLTAYALDELEPAEKQAFAEGVSDGKALLESTDAIRKVGAQLTRILESGAPLPRRRKKRQASGWRSPAVLLGSLGALVAGALAWYFLSGEAEPKARREASPWTVNGDSTVGARARRNGEREGSGRAGGSGGVGGARAEIGSPLRAGEADWEKRNFRPGTERPDQAARRDGDLMESSDDSTEASGEGGARSPGAPTGESARNDPAAEASGNSGASDQIQTAAREASAASNDGRSATDAPAAATDPSHAAGGSKPAVAGGMKPVSPEVAEKKTPAPGDPKEGNPTAPPTPAALGVAKLQRQLATGQWPDPADVSATEMLQQVPLEKSTEENSADAPLTSRVEMARSPWAPDKLLVRVTLKARPAVPPARPPASVVFAIDVSQSMTGPNRLPLVQEGIRLLAERLRPEDCVSVITYAGRAKEALPPGPLGGKGLELRHALKALEAAGQTNGDEGLRLAYATARRARVAAGPNVVVLCTDGNFNLGETDEEILAAYATQAAAEGIKLSVFGFGRSDRNDLRLELLAAKGGGRSCYVNTREEAEQLLAGQIDGLLTPVANAVSLGVAFDSSQVEEVTRFDGTGTAAAESRVENLLPGRSLSALYEIALVPGRGTGAAGLGEWEANFRRAGAAKPERLAARLAGRVEEWTQASASFRFAAAWAELARILREDRARAGADLDRLEDWVRSFLPDDTGGYRSELLDNVAAARLAAGSR